MERQHSLRGFDEVVGTDDFLTADLAYVLSTHGVLKFEEADRSDEIADRWSNAGLNSIRVSNIKRGGSGNEETSDGDD